MEIQHNTERDHIRKIHRKLYCCSRQHIYRQNKYLDIKSTVHTNVVNVKAFPAYASKNKDIKRKRPDIY